ncbi:hypothetical protein C1645_735892 [Glomus cerebriforme]|uniref:Uncharacterized protein n=1 Tax=Glomus cerebriforme TaxID=658196 RepID=A0A397T9T2_9GLOM|nr:hypothetical protein C1645_735892 [Glomus cerebriforme]
MGKNGMLMIFFFCQNSKNVSGFDDHILNLQSRFVIKDPNFLSQEKKQSLHTFTVIKFTNIIQNLTMEYNQNNQFKSSYEEQQSTIAIPPEQSSNTSDINYINYNADNSDFSVMNDDIVPTALYTNNNYSSQQPTSNENIDLQSHPTIISSPYAPQYGYPPQPIENTFSPSNTTIFTNNNNSDQQSMSNENIASTSQSYHTSTSSYAPQSGYPPQQPIGNTFFPFNMTTINPSHSEILSFDIPGFKVIIIPTSSQQDNNTYLNYPSSDIKDNYQS